MKDQCETRDKQEEEVAGASLQLCSDVLHTALVPMFVPIATEKVMVGD